MEAVIDKKELSRHEVFTQSELLDAISFGMGYVTGIHNLPHTPEHKREKLLGELKEIIYHNRRVRLKAQDKN